METIKINGGVSLMDFKNKVSKCAKQHCSAKFVHFIQVRFVILDISPALSAQLIISFGK